LGFFAAAWVLILQLIDRHRTDAESITAWVYDQYAKDDAGRLVRSASLHVSNPGSRPVFDVQLVVGHGFLAHEVTRLGSLAAPTVPVLPPGTDRTWSIEDLVAEVEPQGELRVEVSFRDPAGRQWTRNFDGRLKQRRRLRKRNGLQRSDDMSTATRQLGSLTPANPVAMAIAFYTALDIDDTDERIETLTALCVPESIPSWGDFGDVKTSLAGHGLATFPSYPAPGVAYVKFPADITEHSVAVGPTMIAAKIMTLQYRTDLTPSGWRVFAVGAPISPEDLPPSPGRL
jgi:hypothetical protein